MSKANEMEALYKEVVNRYGHLDAIVANAGIGDHATLASTTEEHFDRTFSINAKGVLFTVQKAIPHMSEGGAVVIIGSTASISVPPGMGIYGGSKAAVRNFVRAWIQDIRG